MMNFETDFISFQKQNELKDSNIIRENYYIKKLNNTFCFYCGNEQIEQYVRYYYVYPHAVAVSVFDGTDWKRYLWKNEQYVLDYTSRYFILSFPHNLLIDISDNTFKVCLFKMTEIEIVIERVLLSFNNFLLDNDRFYFLDDNTSRKLTYDKQTKKFDLRVMKKNPLVCKKTTVYFDNITGMDIYNTKSNKLIETVQRSYKLEKYLYIIKKDYRYVVLNLMKHEVLFTGNTFHFINNSGWIMDKNKNEIAIITPEEIDILKYDEYMNGTNTSMKKINRKNFGG